MIHTAGPYTLACVLVALGLYGMLPGLAAVVTAWAAGLLADRAIRTASPRWRDPPARSPPISNCISSRARC